MSHSRQPGGRQRPYEQPPPYGYQQPQNGYQQPEPDYPPPGDGYYQQPAAEAPGQAHRPAVPPSGGLTLRLSRRALIVTGAVIVVVIVALALVLGLGGSAGSITAHGTEEVSVNPLDGTSVQDAFPDVTDGSQVTVVNSSGQVIGTGTLSYDPSDAISGDPEWSEFYDFTVTVSGGQPRYGIQVGSGHGTVWFTAQQMQRGPTLCLGDGC
jgi:hypothetical protein